ncbi:MAG: hypothetical protein HQ472_10860 [Ignavibacteria bacterium]|nr:hypothetical protein [Ignavibacteria bacterium]
MIKTGYIEFDKTDTDFISTTKPAHLYGVRKRVDIAHNQQLGNMNLVRLTLVDASYMDDPSGLQNYRSGAGAMCGSNLSNVRFRNIPHWAAIDNDTVRVWATMSRGKPTAMKFWYILETL